MREGGGERAIHARRMRGEITRHEATAEFRYIGFEAHGAQRVTFKRLIDKTKKRARFRPDSFENKTAQ